MKKTILVTGSRYWTNKKQLISCIQQKIPPEDTNIFLIHGDCWKGADAIINEYAESKGWDISKCPADWRLYGRKAGPIRNEDMVSKYAMVVDYFFVFPTKNSIGTFNCLKHIENADKKENAKIIIEYEKCAKCGKER